MNKESDTYYPLLAGFEGNEYSDASIAMWNRFYDLPPIVKSILKSEELSDLIYGLEKRFYLQEVQTERIAILVRQYFLREIAEVDFVYQVANICRITQEDAVKILRAIVSIKPKEESTSENEKPVKKNLFTTTLTNAFSQFPAVKDQIITNRPIITKPFLQPLQPSIKNWIMVYEKILGGGKHNALERGEFVFRAEATRGLEQWEREVLITVLRSRDENTPLVVDMDQRKIIFDDGEINAEISTKKEEKFEKMTESTHLSNLDALPQAPMMETQKQADMNWKTDTVEKRELPTYDTLKQPVMQHVSHLPQMNNDQNPEVVRSVQNVIPENDALQNEIIKNRIEIDRGLDPVRFSKEPIQKTDDVPRSHMVMGTESVQTIGQGAMVVNHYVASAQNTLSANPQKGTQPVQSAISGKIDFSSNHNLPVEKMEKKELKSTHDYYMSPMGAVHMVRGKDDRSV